MSQKKSKNVPTVAEQQPNKTVEPTAPVVSEQPSGSLDLFKDLVSGISEDKVKMAEAAGAPVTGFLRVIGTMAMEIQEIKKTLPETVKTKMAEVINEAQAKQKALYDEALKANPQLAQGGAGGGGLFGQLLQLAPAVLGSSPSPITDEIVKKVVDAGLDQMFAGTQLLKAMQTKIMAEMGAKVITSETAK